jgi:uncharacterized protein
VSPTTDRRSLLGLALALALLPAIAAAQGAGEPQPILDQEPLTIETAGGPVTFLVEMARTPAEQSRGLMFRTLVPPGTGMLFVHTRPRPVSMWMRNTPTSLDMLFIDQDGTIESIARDTTPFSETVISSNGPVAGVLEIGAGEAERLGIQEGDRVRHPHFADR